MSNTGEHDRATDMGRMLTAVLSGIGLALVAAVKGTLL